MERQPGWCVVATALNTFSEYQMRRLGWVDVEKTIQVKFDVPGKWRYPMTGVLSDQLVYVHLAMFISSFFITIKTQRLI